MQAWEAWGTMPVCVSTAHKAGSACELSRELLTGTGRVLHSLSQCMPCSDNGHSCLSLHISYCPLTLHTACSSCILCSKARLLSKLLGSMTACQHNSGGYPQRWQWSWTMTSLCHRKKNVSREKNASNHQPRNLDSSSRPTTDIVCPPLESCHTSWHLSFFLSKVWGGIQQSLGHFQSKRLYSNDYKTVMTTRPMPLKHQPYRSVPHVMLLKVLGGWQCYYPSLQLLILSCKKKL